MTFLVFDSCSLVAMAFMVPFVLFVLWMLRGALGARESRATLSEATLHCAPAVLRPGASGELHLRLVAHHPLELTAVRLRLLTEEHVTDSFENTSYQHVIHEQSLPLELPSTLHEPLRATVPFTLSEHVPATWRGEDNSLSTRALLEIRLKQWDYLSLEQELTVLPLLPAGAQLPPPPPPRFRLGFGLGYPIALRFESSVARLGESVRGTVSWKGSHPELEQLEWVRLGCYARVHGDGTQEQAALQELRLPRPPHLPAEVPFSFRLPDNGPTTYLGHHLKIEWYVYLVLELPSQRNPRVEWGFTVLPRIMS
jgi:hypothetical protein